VQARTSEIGLQMALGATRGRLVSRVIGDGCRMALTGIAVGLVMAGVMAHSLRSLLYQVSPYDPVVHVAVMVLLLTATVVACLVPARRAALVDPSVALRVG
jgi:ABC-type antimicrobial peptide transport system permease subunit